MLNSVNMEVRPDSGKRGKIVDPYLADCAKCRKRHKKAINKHGFAGILDRFRNDPQFKLRCIQQGRSVAQLQWEDEVGALPGVPIHRSVAERDLNVGRQRLYSTLPHDTGISLDRDVRGSEAYAIAAEIVSRADTFDPSERMVKWCRKGHWVRQQRIRKDETVWDRRQNAYVPRTYHCTNCNFHIERMNDWFTYCVGGSRDRPCQVLCGVCSMRPDNKGYVKWRAWRG